MKHPAPAASKQIILEDASDISATKHYTPRLSRAAVAHDNKISKGFIKCQVPRIILISVQGQDEARYGRGLPRG